MDSAGTVAAASAAPVCGFCGVLILFAALVSLDTLCAFCDFSLMSMFCHFNRVHGRIISEFCNHMLAKRMWCLFFPVDNSGGARKIRKIISTGVLANRTIGIVEYIIEPTLAHFFFSFLLKS